MHQQQVSYLLNLIIGMNIGVLFRYLSYSSPSRFESSGSSIIFNSKVFNRINNGVKINKREKCILEEKK